MMIDGISMSASPQYLINRAISMPRMSLNHELISNSEPLGFSRQISGLLQGALSLSSVRVWRISGGSSLTSLILFIDCRCRRTSWLQDWLTPLSSGPRTEWDISGPGDHFRITKGWLHSPKHQLTSVTFSVLGPADYQTWRYPLSPHLDSQPKIKLCLVLFLLPFLPLCQH